MNDTTQASAPFDSLRMGPSRVLPGGDANPRFPANRDGTFITGRAFVRGHGPGSPRRPSVRLRKTDHAKTSDPALSVLRWQGALHAERGALGREELSALRDARRASRVAREALRSHADPADEAGRPGLAEDRYPGAATAGEEDGEKGLAEHGAALQAVAPKLADRGAALAAFTVIGGLVRLHDHEGVLRNRVPSWLADDQERIIVGPRLELQEGELLRGE